MNQGFANDADSARRGKGLPGLRFLPTAVPCEATLLFDIDKAVDDVLDAIVAALTAPLTEEEAAPRNKVAATPERIIFEGNIEAVNRHFYMNGWTDGLPIIPPTEDAVATMLTGTDLPRDYLLGHLVSRLGKATVEKIAINAVMAGALPIYMPVLIAATQLLIGSEPGFLGFGTFGFSTGSWAPFWIINGPVREELESESQFRRPESRQYRQCRHRARHGTDHQEYRRSPQRRGRYGCHGKSHEVQHGDRRKRRTKSLGAFACGIRL